MINPDRALITGATRGIGRAIAETLALSGYEVVLNYAHDGARASSVVKELREQGYAASLSQADVTSAEDVARMIDDVEQGGALDLLVNNVGDFLFKPFLETTPEEWEGILRSNLMSAVLCCREILPRMRSRHSGRIINIGWPNAEVLRSKPNTLPYAIAKAGLVLLTKTLAATEGPFGVRVNAVCPGFVENGENPPNSIEGTIPLGRLADASEVAEAVAYLASDRAAYVTGAILNIHGGAFL